MVTAGTLGAEIDGLTYSHIQVLGEWFPEG